MRRSKLIAAAAASTAAALVLSACAPADDTGDEPGEGDGTSTVTIGWNQPFYSYNDDTSNGNATANAIIKYMMNDGFNYYNTDLELVQNTSYGTYEKISDDPLTVEYTLADTATWSDGTPVDAADWLLMWAGQSGQLNTLGEDEVERDPDTGIAQPAEGDVFFDSSSPGLALVTETPEISEDRKTITLVYSEPFADWELDFGLHNGVPAHVTTMRALGIDDPVEAKEAFITAVQERDNAALSQISSFWNTGFDFTSMPDDELLYAGSGAYTLSAFQENDFLTLVPNENYEGDNQATFDEVTVRWNEDPLALAQALANGEVDLISPQATPDFLAAVEAIEGVTVETQNEAVYEHIDLVFNNRGPFDPRKYGGNQETALMVRQAFLKTIPRQAIVDRLIKPLNPDAVVRDSQLIVIGAPGYDEMVEQNGSAEYAEVDLAGARRLLQQAGVETPVRVRFLYAQGNERRESLFQLVRESAEQGGFEIVDAGSPDWGELLGSGTYDASTFGWQSTSTAVTDSQAIFVPGGINNLTGYRNPEVTALYDELLVETDEQRQIELQIEIEKHLWADAYGVTIFEFPGVAAYSGNIENVQPIPISPTIFHAHWEWEPGGGS